MDTIITRINRHVVYMFSVHIHPRIHIYAWTHSKSRHLFFFPPSFIEFMSNICIDREFNDTLTSDGQVSPNLLKVYEKIPHLFPQRSYAT